jgi:hypothetical protein
MQPQKLIVAVGPEANCTITEVCKPMVIEAHLRQGWAQSRPNIVRAAPMQREHCGARHRPPSGTRRQWAGSWRPHGGPT